MLNTAIFPFFYYFVFFLQFLFDAIWELFRQILNHVAESVKHGKFLTLNIQVS